jgi:hypothetical protein
MTGGPTTVMVSDADSPFPPCMEVTTLVVFFSTPAVMLVTLTLNVQLAAALRIAPDRLMLADPATALMVPPPQLPVRLFGVETTRPEGSGSVNPSPLSATVSFGLSIVNVRPVLVFNGVVADPNPSAIVGGATTVTLAEAVPPLPALEVTALVILFFTPAPSPVTFSENVQLAPPVSPAPDKLTLLEPATAVMVPPPQLPLELFGVAITKPSGNVSLNPIPVSETVPFGLLMLNVRLVLAFSAMVAAPNPLPIVGGFAGTGSLTGSLVMKASG